MLQRNRFRCALTETISVAAFLLVVGTGFSVRADDATVLKAVNDLNRQMQDQLARISTLEAKLNGRNDAVPEHKKAARRQAGKPLATPQMTSAPGVVAPLQPSVLGTLLASEAAHPETIHPVERTSLPASTVSAPTVSVPMAPPALQQQPVVSVQQQQMAAPHAPANNGVAPAHVGEAPPLSNKPPEVPVLAGVGGVLTPFGDVTLEPFAEYSRSSVNTFAFQGVEVIPAFLIGTVAADRTARDLFTTGVTGRVGVTNRLELETRVPFVGRQDTFTSTIPNTSNQTTNTTATGYGLGDVEFAAHYQINDGREDWPFLIGNLRYKSDTGTSPYGVKYNADGSARVLATGSGFNAFEPSLTAILPSDPATLFANLGYIHSIGKTINRNVAGNNIGDVTPGDTYVASVGMGVALNDKLSFTFGYEHDYVRPTTTVIATNVQNSASLQIGSALSGISYRLNKHTNLNLNLAAGVTKDAPDTTITLRVPYTFNAF